MAARGRPGREGGGVGQRGWVRGLTQQSSALACRATSSRLDISYRGEKCGRNESYSAYYSEFRSLYPFSRFSCERGGGSVLEAMDTVYTSTAADPTIPRTVNRTQSRHPPPDAAALSSPPLQIRH